MMFMTTTSTRVVPIQPRDAKGRFGATDHTLPELTLDADGDFDLATFMQAPPTEPAPFTLLQPVIYTGLGDEETHATVVGIDDEGYLQLLEREPGSFAESTYEDRTFTVDPRYVREDTDVSLEDIRRQGRAVEAAAQRAAELASSGTWGTHGIDAYASSLQVRRWSLAEDKGAWERHQEIAGRVDRAVSDLVQRELLAPQVESWLYLEGESGTPDEFNSASEAFDDDGRTLARTFVQAEALAEFKDFTALHSDDLDKVTAALQEARELGQRMELAESATAAVDDDVNAMTVDEAREVFGAAVEKLPVRKATAYRKACLAVTDAFDQLSNYSLISRNEHREWAYQPGHESDPGATLVRLAGQAAVLRHFKPETGLTDAQLDAISTVFDGAVKTYEKGIAA